MSRLLETYKRGEKIDSAVLYILPPLQVMKFME